MPLGEVRMKAVDTIFSAYPRQRDELSTFPPHLRLLSGTRQEINVLFTDLHQRRDTLENSLAQVLHDFISSNGFHG